MKVLQKQSKWRKVLIVVVGLALAVAGTVVFGGSASAATPATKVASATPAPTVATRAIGRFFPGGPGHPGSIWAGTWDADGRGFCIDFNLHNPDAKGSVPVTGNIPSMGRAASAQVKMLTNLNSTTTNKDVAANSAWAIWTVQNGPGFKPYMRSAIKRGVITKARKAAIDKLIAQSKLQGPFTLTIAATDAVLGQTSSGTVKAVASNGKPASGNTVSFSATNASIVSASTKTNAAGFGRFTFKVADVGDVTLNVLMTAPSASKVILTTPSRGRQRVVKGNFKDTARATVTLNKLLAAPTMTVNCAVDCTGTATVTFSATTPKGAALVRFAFNNGPAEVAALYVAGGTTNTSSAVLNDGNQVGSSYCQAATVGGPCTGPVVTLPGTTEIVCPAIPALTYTGACPCNGGANYIFTVTLAAANPRAYTAAVLKNGAAVESLPLVNGTPATFKQVDLVAGDRLQVVYHVVAPAKDGNLFDTTNNR